MKKDFFRRGSLAILFCIGMVIAPALQCGAWEVQVTNNYKYPVNVYVNGLHFFWYQQDCKITGMQPGQTTICTMPAGICPFTISGDYWVGDANGYSLTLAPLNCTLAVACCWDLKVNISSLGMFEMQ
jgi:hypothetical protein